MYTQDELACRISIWTDQKSTQREIHQHPHPQHHRHASKKRDDDVADVVDDDDRFYLFTQKPKSLGHGDLTSQPKPIFIIDGRKVITIMIYGGMRVCCREKL